SGIPEPLPRFDPQTARPVGGRHRFLAVALDETEPDRAGTGDHVDVALARDERARRLGALIEDQGDGPDLDPLSSQRAPCAGARGAAAYQPVDDERGTRPVDAGVV